MFVYLLIFLPRPFFFSSLLVMLLLFWIFNIFTFFNSNENNKIDYDY